MRASLLLRRPYNGRHSCRVPAHYARANRDSPNAHVRRHHRAKREREGGKERRWGACASASSASLVLEGATAVVEGDEGDACQLARGEVEHLLTEARRRRKKLRCIKTTAPGGRPCRDGKAARRVSAAATASRPRGSCRLILSSGDSASCQLAPATGKGCCRGVWDTNWRDAERTASGSLPVSPCRKFQILIC